MTFAEEELKRSGGGRVLDLGCGAGRNALPLAGLGWNVVGADLSWPMLCAAVSRTHEHRLDDRLHVVLAPMERIPARDRSFELVIAHGIWNLAELCPRTFCTFPRELSLRWLRCRIVLEKLSGKRNRPMIVPWRPRPGRSSATTTGFGISSNAPGT